MKKTFYTLTVMLLLSTTALLAQKNVKLHINHLLDGKPFQMMNAAANPEKTYFFKVEMLRYYVSGIKITHDGGTVTEIKDLYLLVNVEQSPEFDLGLLNINKVEAIEFSIGVDKAKNHLDPTTYPATHPLAMQNPTMHWGWTSGYRFVTFEGYAGTTAATATTNFQIHTLEDKLYKSLKINASAKEENGNSVIELNADYSNLLKSIKASIGVISHGSTGASLTLTNNFVTGVFTSKSSVAVEDLFTLNVKAYPNPATSQIAITAPMNNIDNQEIVITNIAGQVVLKAQKNSETLQLPLSLSPGNYMISIAEKGKTVGREKLVIIK
jgi:hypothetical protein